MHKHSPICGLLVWLLSLALIYSSPAQQAVGWRGDGNGQYPLATPPTEWSKTTNVLWCTRMPATSNASPILVGERLFVCSEPADLLCVSARDGRILWQKSNSYLETLDPETAAMVRQDQPEFDRTRAELSARQRELQQQERLLKDTPDNADVLQKAETLRRQIAELKEKLKNLRGYALPQTHPTNGYSSATPTSDGKHVYAVFGNGVIACYDMEGNRKWIRFLDTPKHEYGHCASPLLMGDKVLIFINDLVALQASTGNILWRTPVAHRWGSPICARVGTEDVAITAGGEIVRVNDGKLLAKGLASLDYCAPIIGKGVVYFIQNGGRAIRLPDEAGASIAPVTLWTTMPRAERYYASPVYWDGLIYAINQHAVFSVIDAQTGQVVYERRLNLGGGTVYPSVTLAGKFIYVMSDSGVTLVLQPGREYVEVSRNTLEGFRCCPVFSGKRMYVRGFENLYCIGE